MMLRITKARGNRRTNPQVPVASELAKLLTQVLIVRCLLNKSSILPGWPGILVRRTLTHSLRLRPSNHPHFAGNGAGFENPSHRAYAQVSPFEMDPLGMDRSWGHRNDMLSRMPSRWLGLQRVDQDGHLEMVSGTTLARANARLDRIERIDRQRLIAGIGQPNRKPRGNRSPRRLAPGRRNDRPEHRGIPKRCRSTLVKQLLSKTRRTAQLPDRQWSDSRLDQTRFATGLLQSPDPKPVDRRGIEQAWPPRDR